MENARKHFVEKKKETTFFKLGNFSKALKQYRKSLVALEDLFKKKDPVSDNSDNGLEQDVKEKATVEDVKLFVTLQSNAGMMCLKLKKNKEALKHFSEGLDRDEKHLKCLTRMAQAQLGLGNLEEAASTVKRCIILDPENKYCIVLKRTIEKEMRAYLQKQKILAAKMFG